MTPCYRVALAALVLMTGHAVAQKKKYTEQYDDRWVVSRTAAGYTFAESRYTARGPDGRTARMNKLAIFTNAPAGGNTDVSNWWVYWINPKGKGGKPVIWARCPTPKHPKYRQWQKQAKGRDLWQIIPPGDRKEGEINVNRLKWPKAGGDEKVISTEATGAPTIDGDPPGPGVQPITCIDFGGAISRYTR